FGRETGRLDGGLCRLDALFGNARDQEVLPDGETDIAITEIARQRGEPPHLIRGELADRQHDANPAKPVLLLPMSANVRRAIEWRARGDRLRLRSHELAPELLLHGAEEFLKTPGVEHVFETRLGAVGAVAMVDEDAHHGIRHLGRVSRLDHHAGIVCEAAMPGDAAESQPEPDARLDAETL